MKIFTKQKKENAFCMEQREQKAKIIPKKYQATVWTNFIGHLYKMSEHNFILE